jgi:hypothetical protein
MRDRERGRGEKEELDWKGNMFRVLFCSAEEKSSLVIKITRNKRFGQ